MINISAKDKDSTKKRTSGLYCQISKWFKINSRIKDYSFVILNFLIAAVLYMLIPILKVAPAQTVVDFAIMSTNTTFGLWKAWSFLICKL